MNGNKVGYGINHNLPFSADITDVVEWGKDNELVICVRNAIALMNPEFVDTFDPAEGRLGALSALTTLPAAHRASRAAQITALIHLQARMASPIANARDQS